MAAPRRRSCQRGGFIHAVAKERKLHSGNTHAMCARLAVRLAVVRGRSGAGAVAGMAEARRGAARAVACAYARGVRSRSVCSWRGHAERARLCWTGWKELGSGVGRRGARRCVHGTRVVYWAWSYQPRAHRVRGTRHNSRGTHWSTHPDSARACARGGSTIATRPTHLPFRCRWIYAHARGVCGGETM